MANTSSARKRIRSAQRKHDRNRAVRSAVRTAVSRARRSGAVSAEEALEAGRLAVSALDKAAEHGVLHPRNVARRKSRLMRMLAVRSATDEAPSASVRKPSAKGTRAKPATPARKPAASRSKPVTKTERTAQRTRRTAGSGAERE